MKARIAHISDTHVESGARLNELVTVLGAFVDEARKGRVDAILHTGDAFHRRSNPEERLVFADFLKRAAEVAPVIAIKGNHDAPDDLEIFNHLKTVNPVWVLQRPHKISLRGIDVHGIPWFDKANLVAQLGADVDADSTTRQTIAAAESLLVATAARVKESRTAGQVPIVAGHLLVAGSETSTGQLLLGVTVELSAGDLLDTGAGYIALGHIHKAQDWGSRMAYAGSPIRQNFGEPESKGFRLVEIESEGDGWNVRNDFIELPARRITLIERDFSNGVTLWSEDDPLWVKEILHDAGGENAEWQIHDGDLVRIRYRIRPQDLHLVDERAVREAALNAGAYDVKVEAVIVQEARVRSEAITVATSTWDKCEAYFESKGIAIDSATAGRLKSKLSSIESGEEIASVTAA